MKKFKYILITLLIIPLTWSCSEDIMDRINENKNAPTDVASKLIVTDVIANTAFSVIGSDLSFYSSIYIEHNAGIYGQMYNAEIRSGEPILSTTYNNTWGSIYANLYEAKIIIEKCSPGGTEEGNFHTLGIAQILTAYNLAVLTDLFGDVPWTEALQPGVIFTPVIDDQESIYNDIFEYLDNAIANLKKTSTYPSLGTQDPIYGGNKANWLKLAYGLKARYLMRLSFRTAEYQDVIAYSDSSFATAVQQATFKYNGSSTNSPYYSFFTDRDYFGASQSLHQKLALRNDPRDNVFFKVHPKATGSITFAPNGTPSQLQSFYGVSAISTETAPTYLLSFHEVQFLKAEAYARLNELVKSDSVLKIAVRAAFAKVNVGLSATVADNYYTDNVKSRFDANALSEVMTQKYIAFYEEESLEAYNDYRRLKAMGNNFITLNNPLNTSKFPLRFTYGASDVTTNNNVAAAYGNGTYVYTENVWWAGGSR